MLSLDQGRRYFVYQGVTDFRKGISGLGGLIRNEMDQDPLDGSVYIFFNRHRNRVKILAWDHDGFALFYKCLEQGTFEFPSSTTAPHLLITSSELRFILEGVELKSIRKRKRFSL